MKTTWTSLKKKLVKDLGWFYCNHEGQPDYKGRYLRSPTRNIGLWKGYLCVYDSNLNYLRIGMKLPSVQRNDIQYAPTEKLLYWVDILGNKVLALDIS